MKRELFAGIDIHKDSFYGTILDKAGDVVNEGKLPNTKDGIRTFFAGISSSRIKTAIEACGVWRGFYRRLQELGYNVVLANPTKTNAIARKKKTDKVDSKILADLLRTGYLPEVYIPSEDVMKIRDIARHRTRLVRFRVILQCKVKGYMLRDGMKYTKNIWNQKCMSALKQHDERIGHFISIIETVNVQIKEVTREINNIAGNRHLTKLLQTIPGIGNFSSLLVLAEIGDIKRFENPKSLVSYAGLCPGIHQSGQKSFDVTNRACNKWLKWIVVECAGRAVMLDKRYMKHYYKIKERKGFRTARRSVARKMLTDIWHILVHEEPYRFHSPLKKDRITPCV